MQVNGPDGKVYNFPDDVTDQELVSFFDTKPKAPSKWDKVKAVGKQVLQEAGDAAEGVRSIAGMAATLPIDLANYAGAVVDSIVQEDISRENIDKNVERRNQSVQTLKNYLNPPAQSQRAQAMQQVAGNALAAPGQLAEQGVTALGNQVINTEDYPNVVPQLAGAASVLADIAVPVDAALGIKAMKGTTPKVKKGYIPQSEFYGIGENKTPSNFVMQEGSVLEVPVRPTPYRQEPVINDLPPVNDIVRKRNDVVAAVEADNAVLGDAIDAGRNRPERVAENYGLKQELSQEPVRNDMPTQYVKEPALNAFPKEERPLPPSDLEIARQQAAPLEGLYNTAVEIKNTGGTYDNFREALVNSGVPVSDLLANFRNAGFEGAKDFFDRGVPYQNVKGGIQPLEQRLGFNHENLSGPTVVTARDSMLVEPTVKPVVKGTVEEVKSMVKGKELSPTKHEVFYPEGTTDPNAPAYIIRKEGTKKTPTTKVKEELKNPQTESKWLGYPDRTNVPPGERATVAVTKDNVVLTDPATIVEASANKEVKWAAEGKPEEVVQKANEVAQVSEPISTPSLEKKTSPSSNLGLSDPILESERGAVDTIPEDTTVDLHAGIHPKEVVKGVDEGIKFIRNLTGDILTENMKTKIRSLVEFPQYAAENIPDFKPIYELYRQRINNRESIAYDIFGEELGYEGFKELHKMERKLSDAEKKDYSKIIQIQDIEKRNFTAEDLRGNSNPLGRPVSENVIALHGATERVMQRVADTIITKTKELVFKPYEKEAWFPELMELVDNGVSAKEYKQSEYANKEVARALAEVTIDLAKWEDLQESITKNPGYMFRDRPFGEQLVRVFEVDEFGNEVEVYMRPSMNKLGAKLKEKAINAALNEDGTVKDATKLKQLFPENFNPDATYRVQYDFNPQMPEEILMYSGTQTAKASVFNRVLDSLKDTNDIDPAVARKVASAVLNDLTDMYRARGFGRRMMRRKENLIEGYDSDAYVKTITSNVNAMAGWLSKAEYATLALRELKNVPAEHQAYANKFVRNTLTNSDATLAKVGSTARTALALKTLAYKVVSPILNGTQNWIMGVPELGHRLRKLGIDESPSAIMAKAQADAVQQATVERLGKKSILSPYELQAIEEFSRIGGVKAQGVREIAGMSNTGVSQGLHKLTEIGMTPFSAVETIFNREAAFLGMFRTLSKKGWDYQKAFAEAADYTNTVHGDMSAHNLPLYFQNEVGRTALSLQRYSGLYLNWLFNRAVMQGAYRPVARSLLTVAAMGGLGAVGLTQANSLMERMFGKSPKTLLKKYVFQTAKKNDITPDMAEKINTFIQYGLPASVGMNISRNMEIQAPFLSVLISGDAETTGEALSGVWASTAKSLGTATKAIKTGQYQRAVEALSPVDAFANILRAQRMGTDGATTLSGNPILDTDNKQLVLTNSEMVLKALGIQPDRLVQKYDIQATEKRLEEYYRNKKAEVNTLLRVAKTPAQKEAAKKEKRKLNNELNKLNGLIPKLGKLRDTNKYAERRRRRFERSLTEEAD